MSIRIPPVKERVSLDFTGFGKNNPQITQTEEGESTDFTDFTDF
jgi:hypothetical protein